MQEPEPFLVFPLAAHSCSLKSSPKNPEKENGQSREIKLNPAQQLWKALMRNPAKAGHPFITSNVS